MSIELKHGVKSRREVSTMTDLALLEAVLAKYKQLTDIDRARVEGIALGIIYARQPTEKSA